MAKKKQRSPAARPRPAVSPRGEVAATAEIGRASWRSALPLLIAVAALAATFAATFFWNEDFWWYLASGEAILEAGEIPDDDPFLYPEEARGRWITHSWLWTVLVALLWQAGGGLVGPVVAAVAVAIALVVLLFTAGRVDRHGTVNAVLVLSALWTLNHRLAMKAELASWVLLLVFLRILDRRPVVTPRAALALVALQWLWSNLHGGYPLGLVVAAAWTLGPRLARGRGAEARGAPLWLLPALAVAALATPGLFVARLRVLGSFLGLTGPVEGLPETSIAEWQATFDGPLDLYAGMYIAFVVVGGLGFLLGRTPGRLPRALAWGAMAGLGLEAVRFVPPFVLVSVVVTLRNLEHLAPALRRRAGSTGRRRLALAASLGLVAAVAALAVGLRQVRTDVEVGQSAGSPVSLSPFSTAPGAARYLERHAPPDAIFNDMMLGGYLIHRLAPGRRLYADNRNTSERLLAEYAAALSSPAEWRRVERRRDVRTVVMTSVYTRALLVDVLAADPRWRLVLVDPTATVFVRDPTVPVELSPRRVAAASPASDPGVPYLAPRSLSRRVLHAVLRADPDDLLVTYLDRLGRVGQLDALLALADAALERRPDLGAVWWLRGTARLRRGDAARGLADLEAAIERGADTVESRLQLATLLARDRRYDDARRHLAAARRQAPDDPRVEQLLRRLPPGE